MDENYTTIVIHTIFWKFAYPMVNEPTESYQIQHLIKSFKENMKLAIIHAANHHSNCMALQLYIIVIYLCTYIFGVILALIVKSIF